MKVFIGLCLKNGAAVKVYGAGDCAQRGSHTISIGGIRMAGKREILEAYIDACALVRETEEDLQRLRKQEFAHGKVKGSNPEFPYQPRRFTVSGVVETVIGRGSSLEREREALRWRRENAERIKVKAEKVMKDASVRVQRIIRYKVFEGLTWEEVAVRMGGKATAESVRKEYQRFLK